MRNYVEGRRGGLEEDPSTYTNGQEVEKHFKENELFFAFGAPKGGRAGFR